MRNINSHSRRDFLKTSAQIAGVATLGAYAPSLLAQNVKQDSKQAPKISQKGATMQTITLNNGLKMPILGLGTYTLTGKAGQKAMSEAIEVGYRLFDSAQMYHNEAELGAAISNAIKGGMKREKFFIQTKLLESSSEDSAKKSIEKSLQSLGLDYIDSLLIHEPYTHSKAMYRVMESFYKQGILKSIGISNFGTKAYSEFVQTCEVIPAINQCETHLLMQQKPLREAMKAQGTLLQSWSPFIAGKNVARGSILENPTLQSIAQKYNKTPAQVVLRFLIEQGISVILKTSKKHRMQENLNVFDFSLSAQDKQILSGLDTNKSAFSWTNY
ncbi:aldo/keto reductase [Campylobacter sp. MIT 21-1685]|uniref:aldo/keto reductase n=1 Tax=unclassified Campylobacter TaxID=2593542 RepID=UPI00224B643F|nr:MULTISPECIES: aldo/keto reductase [unclassified Campylobacter]MCX2683671.1 aldo/keto reductase [Campylobacter sp. MIT 21-1684]MCX2751956.1 aldo/keto reductase [Campylobacter sp. MIT 21-1682]MCX2808182.1 aldo/keto reductase [Campylobacter sp. MIT 21-1685]